MSARMQCYLLRKQLRQKGKIFHNQFIVNKLLYTTAMTAKFMLLFLIWLYAPKINIFIRIICKYSRFYFETYRLTRCVSSAIRTWSNRTTCMWDSRSDIQACLGRNEGTCVCPLFRRLCTASMHVPHLLSMC